MSNIVFYLACLVFTGTGLYMIYAGVKGVIAARRAQLDDPDDSAKRMRARLRSLHPLRKRIMWKLHEKRYLAKPFCVLAFSLTLIFIFSPWPLTETLKHMAAAPSCAAARFVDLAPARQGNPGYYPWHDADNDKIACEDWPRKN